MKTYSKICLLIGLFCSSFILQSFVAENAFAKDKVYRFTFAGVIYKGGTTSLGLDRFAEKVNKESGGRIVIKTIHGTSLGGEREMIESIQMGTLDGGYFGGILGSFYPQYNIFNVPFLFRDEYWANRFLEGELGQDILKGLETINLKAFGYISYGFVGVATKNVPINVPDDFVGLKIRTKENKLCVDGYKALGVNVVTMSAGDALVGMQQGLVDGIDTLSKAILHDYHIDEMANYVTFCKIVLSPCAIVMDAKKFNSLPPDLQRLMEKIGKEVSYWFKHKYLPRREIQNLAESYKVNKKLIMTEPDPDPFRRKCAPLYKKILKGEKYPYLSKMLEKAMKLQGINVEQ